jgi:hypothetical protein
MILDYRNDPATALQFTVYDAMTGRCLDAEHVFYVDTDRGFYDVYVTINRAIIADPTTGRAMTERRRRPVAVFRKSEASSERG